MSSVKRFIFLAAIVVLVSCKQDHRAQRLTQQYSAAIKELAAKKLSADVQDSVLQVWRRYQEDPIVLQEPVLLAKVKYQIGKLYGMSGKDSAQEFIQQAMDVIERTEGNEKEKALIYNGLGNVLNQKVQTHQANYYYNKAAMLLLSDATLGVPPLDQCKMLLAAAQSNSDLYQYSLAQRMNLAALALMPQVPADNPNQERVYSQLIFTANKSGIQKDSIAAYLQRLENLYAQFGANLNPRYLNECKVVYFDGQHQYDSSKKYLLANEQLDYRAYREDSSNYVVTTNLYTNLNSLVLIHLYTNNVGAAGNYLKAADELLSLNKNSIQEDEIVRSKKIKSKYYSALGNPTKALQEMQQAMELKESIYEKENAQAIAEMNALYQLQAKDNSIKRLNEGMKVNQLQLERSRLLLLIAGLAVLLLLIFIVLFYSIYKQRKLRAETEKVQLQQQLLRTQMEPHFIFNTLAALQSFVRTGKNDAAIKYLSQFSRLLRSSLELSRKNLASVGDEISALENYLSLQQMRFEQAFQYSVTVHPAVDWDAVMIPPMLIQPFVENAILHGVDLRNKNGFVNLTLQLQGDYLKVTIVDSGKSAAANARPEHQSLSGAISRERLQLITKEQKRLADVSYSKHGENGTCVVINIPVSDLK